MSSLRRLLSGRFSVALPRKLVVSPHAFMRTLATTTKLPEFGSPDFGITKRLKGKNFKQAIELVEKELKQVGFGVITKIDMKETMQEKLDVELDQPYVILGACNPKLAHEALQSMPAVGLLLPCNIVVTEDANGSAIVSALRPLSLFGVVSESEIDMQPLAQKVEGMVQSVLERL